MRVTIITSLVFASSIAAAQPPHLMVPSPTKDVVAKPKLVNLFWDPAWDSHQPPGLRSTTIDSLTTSLMASSYFGRATTDYGVSSGGFLAAFAGDPACGGPPSALTSANDAGIFAECMVALERANHPLLLSDVTNTMFVVWVPPSSAVLPNDEMHDNPRCGTSVRAYHTVGSSFTYAVVPLICYLADGMAFMGPLSEEILEGATDPYDASWRDKFTSGGENEVCDVCSMVPTVMLNGVPTQPYWSNSLQACVAGMLPVAQISNWTPFGGSPLASPLAAPNADGRMQVFAISANQVVSRWLDPTGLWTPWTSLGGSVLGRLAEIQNLDTRMEVFALGTDHAIWHAWQLSPNGGWGAFQSLGGNFDAAPTVGRNLDGRLQVFATDSAGAVWTTAQTVANGGWGAWTRLANPAARSAPTVASNLDGRLEVFTVDVSGSILHAWQTTPNGGFTAFSVLLAGGVSTSTFSNALSVVRTADGRLAVFGVDDAQVLQHLAQLTAGGGWSGPISLGSNLMSDPVAAVNADGRLEVFATTAGHTVYHAWQLAAGGPLWTLGLINGAFFATDPAVVSVPADGRLEVFEVGLDGALYEDAQNGPGGSFN
jgi:hypothetical protein